jgi:hypothetical protein
MNHLHLDILSSESYTIADDIAYDDPKSPQLRIDYPQGLLEMIEMIRIGESD